MSSRNPVISIGDDAVLPLTFTNPTTNAPIDITGYSIIVDIWNAGGTSGVAGTIRKTTELGGGVVITSGVGGAADLTIDAADWAPWIDATENQKFRYEVQRINSAGKIHTPTPTKGEFTAAWQRIKPVV